MAGSEQASTPARGGGRSRALAAGGVAVVAGIIAVAWLTRGIAPETAPIHLDMENPGTSGEPLNPSTQSLNRYHSVLREFDEVEVRLVERARKLRLELRDDAGEWVAATDLDITHLVPLLPYAHGGELDAFDAANLLLGEYARNGVQLAYQEHNTHFGVFNASDQVFDGEDEYFFENGQVVANPRVRPKRFNVTNNCLAPRLWEVSATDSVGEMYHGWFEMPPAPYFEMVRRANGLSAPDAELEQVLKYRKDLGDVPLSLDRLRERGRSLIDVRPQLALHKELGGYSTQDSRRKVQKGYFSITREDEVIRPATFAELERGDVFRVHSFVPPGVYSLEEPQLIGYDPDWDRVEIYEVEPLTRYPGQQVSGGELGHVEIVAYASDGRRAIFVGNVPVSLVVTQEDYAIPAFGVGVLLPSEPIERRFLRLREGPAPYYTYLAERDEGGEWRVVNNHETGLEQVFLRPFERDGQLYLRFTLVAYERIVDLLELEVPLDGELAERIRQASRRYTPPLYRVYRDENIL